MMLNKDAGKLDYSDELQQFLQDAVPNAGLELV